MANPFDQFDHEAADNNSDGPVMKPRVDDGTLKGDSLPTRAFRAADNVVRSLGNNLTFGLADKAADLWNGDHSSSDASEMARNRDPASDFIGRAGATAVQTAMGTGLLAKGAGKLAEIAGPNLAKFIPAFRGADIPSQMGTQATVAGGISAVDDVAHGSVPDPGKALASAAGAAVGVPAVQLGARIISPTARFRASGLGLTEAEKSAATASAKSASDLGIPYSVPEAVAAGAPTKAARVEALGNASAATPQGSQVWANFEAGRPPLVAEAAKRGAADLQAGTPPVGLPSQLAAKGAIDDAGQMVANSADPYYKTADKAFGFKAPQNPTVDISKAAVLGNPEVMSALGKAPPSSLKFLDAVKKHMGERYESEVAKPSGETLLTKEIATRKGELNNVLRKNPAYATANDIEQNGQSMLVDPLKAGPLGLMSKSPNAAAQSDNLFNVGTAAESDAAINAAKRLPDGMPRGLLAGRMEDMANRDPMSIGNKLLPTDEAKRVAGAVLSPDQAKNVNDLVSVIKGMRQTGVAPHEFSADSPWAEAWGRLRGYGSGKVAELMQDPKMIAELGKQGIGQKALINAATTFSQLAADEQMPKITDRKRRSER